MSTVNLDKMKTEETDSIEKLLRPIFPNVEAYR